MNKNIIYQFEPLWNEWKIEEYLGSGSTGKVYKIVKRDYDMEYNSAVKFFSIPTEEQLDNFSNFVGNNMNSLSSYLNDYIKDIVNEIKLLYDLKGHSIL